MTQVLYVNTLSPSPFLKCTETHQVSIQAKHTFVKFAQALHLVVSLHVVPAATLSVNSSTPRQLELQSF